MGKVFKFLFVILHFTFYFFHSPVFASGEFTTVYNVSYNVQEDGKTVVTQNVELKNLTSNLYATEYTITLGTTDINNVTASDSMDEIKPEITRESEETRIRLKFNDKVAGRGKSLNFHLRYETFEIAKRQGQIWEVNIPKIEKDPQVEVYNVTLNVPRSFGQPVSSKPRSASGLSWNLSNSSTSGINVLFGSQQIFDFKLIYHLENNSLSPIFAEVALPPDTAYQQIYLKSLTPVPSKMSTDEDGNWLARFELVARQKLDVVAEGKALVFLSPRAEFKTNLTSELKEKYLVPQKYWEVDDEELMGIAVKLKTPRDIYKYVINHLNYNYKRISKTSERLGAKKALENPDLSLCLEFTDLFVALSRAAGIPAREVEGYAQTDNPYLRPLSLVFDILHSWPEYYDQNQETWVAVDPTWEKTTGSLDFFSSLDFSHLTLAIHGLSSERPYPAGSYKNEGVGRDVNITFGTKFPVVSNPSPKLTLKFPDEEVRGSVSGQIFLKNDSPIALYNLNTEFTSSEFNLTPSTWQVYALLPFETKTLSLEAAPKIFFWGKGTVTASLGENKIKAIISLKPYELVVLPVIIIGTIICFSFFVFLIRKKTKAKK